MRLPSFASLGTSTRPLSLPRWLTLAILGIGAGAGTSWLESTAQAEPARKLPPGYVEPPAYTVPTPGRRSAPAYPASNDVAPLESQVAHLAQNDQRQDLRLKNLEKDVGYLEKFAGTASHTAGHTYRPPTPPAAAKFYTVRPGDNLWRIASKHHVSVNDIRTANRMSNDTVMLGQKLVIPGSGPVDAASPSQPQPAAPGKPAVYVVKAGDTFSQIAEAHHLTLSALSKANSSIDPNRVVIGTKLTIPVKNKAPVPVSPGPGSPSAAPQGHAEPPQLTHTVRAGESLGAIAKSYGVPTASVAAANKLTNPDVLIPGKRLIIPAKQTDAAMVAFARTAPSLPERKLANQAPHPAPAADLAPSLAAIMQPGSATSATSLNTSFQPTATESPTPRPANMPKGNHRGVLAYRMDRGDTIESVANMFSTTPEKIRTMNNIADGEQVNAGDEVIVPAMGPVSLN